MQDPFLVDLPALDSRGAGGAARQPGANALPVELVPAGQGSHALQSQGLHADGAVHQLAAVVQLGDGVEGGQTIEDVGGQAADLGAAGAALCARGLRLANDLSDCLLAVSLGACSTSKHSCLRQKFEGLLADRGSGCHQLPMFWV